MRVYRSSFLVGTVLATAFCVMSCTAHAGVLTYDPGVGGTFDPSTPSTFTFTNFGPDTLSNTANYNQAKVIAKWGGTAPLPSGGITVTAVSASNPSIPFGTFTIPDGTAAGALVIPANFTSFSPNFTKAGLSALTLQLTIPTLTVASGFFVDFAVLFHDGGLNTNPTAFQRVTAATPAAVPEPATGLVGLGIAAAAYYRRRRTAKA
ncbi:MAG: hypothetical protein RLZZ436_1011 [Planctomycetota bacterium]